MKTQLAVLCPEEWICKRGQKRIKSFVPKSGPIKRVTIKAKHMQDVDGVCAYDGSVMWIEVET